MAGEAINCPSCGAPLPARRAGADERVCTYCDQRVDAGRERREAANAAIAAAHLESVAYVPPPRKNEGGVPGWVGIGLVAAVLLVIFMIVAGAVAWGTMRAPTRRSQGTDQFSGTICAGSIKLPMFATVASRVPS